MGNCAGYCMADGDKTKQKVTVERGGEDTDGRGVAYIDERRGEFEIDYARKNDM